MKSSRVLTAETDDSTVLMLMAYCSGLNTWENFYRIITDLQYDIEAEMSASNADKWYQHHSLPLKLKWHGLDRPQGSASQWMLPLVAKCWLLMSDAVRAAHLFKGEFSGVKSLAARRA